MQTQSDASRTVRQLPDLRPAITFLREAGPYVLLELVLPGGTLIALLLYFWKQPARRAALRATLRSYVRRATRWFELPGKRLAELNPWAVRCTCGAAGNFAPAAVTPLH